MKDKNYSSLSRTKKAPENLPFDLKKNLVDMGNYN